MQTRELKLRTATPENFKPYGALINRDSADPVFSCEEFDYWDALATDDTGGSVSVGMVEARPQELRAVTFERHTRTGELLAPLDGEVVLVLGRPTAGEAPDPDAVEAFLVPAGSAVMLDRGVWHYAPMVTEKTAHILVVFREGTGDDDKAMVNLEEQAGFRFTVNA